MSVQARPLPEHPALADYFEDRARSFQNRLADAITRFAGSMPFIYIHVLWFAIWIGLRVEKFPFGLLTMIVSLEAIILSTFILISQNRSDLARQTFADHQYRMIQAEERQNEELLALSHQILERLEKRG